MAQHPPFLIEDCAAVAYVAGHYVPSARSRTEGFFGIYIARNDPSVSFWTFTTDGRHLAFSFAQKGKPADELNVEFALIVAWLEYAIPFDQWRMFDVAREEQEALRRLGLEDDYARAQRSIGAVLYQARLGLHFDIGPVPPLFRLRKRSEAELRQAKDELEAIMRSVGLEDE